MDFVQQGALIALALVLAEQPESRAKPLREHINRLYGNKASEVGAQAFVVIVVLLLLSLRRMCMCTLQL